MKALTVIGIILLILLLLALLRVGAEAAYCEASGFSLAIRAGFLSIRLGGGSKKHKASKPKKQPKPETAEPAKKKSPSLPPMPMILSLIEQGVALLCRLVSRLRVELLRLHFTSSFPDPADTAMVYAAVGTAMDGLLRVGGKNLMASDLRADIDFDRGSPQVDLRLRVTIRIGQIIAAAASFGFGFLKDFIRYKRSDRHG